jgi:WD40 repeat protein
VSLSGHIGRVTAVATAPGSSWVASGGEDRTVRIWDPATGQARAMMRLDDIVNASAWLSAKALVVGGIAGLHVFDFLTGASSATADSRQE